jgi:hypothetical protein
LTAVTEAPARMDPVLSYTVPEICVADVCPKESAPDASKSKDNR